MPGFPQVLDAIADAWKDRRDEVDQHADQITAALQQLAIGVEQIDQESSIPDDSRHRRCTATI